MLSDGRLTRKEHDLLKELVIRKDPDLLEVASVITHPDDIDSGNLKELNKYFKNKLEVFMREAFTKLYSRVTQDDAYTIANQSTLRMDPDDSQEFTYGEVDFESFSEILTVAVAGLEQRRKFVDLGHGTGKAVLMAALLCDFETLIGIEILSGLVKCSREMLIRFDELISTWLTDPPFVSFLEGSFVDSEHSQLLFDADLIFANSTCFSNEIMVKMAKAAEAMRVGSRFITFTVALPSPYFKVIFKKLMRMSWGDATIFLHERIETAEGIDRSEVLNRNEKQTESPRQMGASVDFEEDSGVTEDDMCSTNTQRPVDLRSEASSIISRLTTDDYKSSSPSKMNQQFTSSISSLSRRIDGDLAVKDLYVDDADEFEVVEGPGSDDSENDSPIVVTKRGYSQPTGSEKVEDLASSSGEKDGGDWFDVGASLTEDFDIFDFVSKYARSPG